MRNLFALLKLYREIIGLKVLVLLTALMLIPPLLEGLSTTFLLPLLQGLEDDNGVNRLFKSIFSSLNIEFNLLNVLIALVLVITLSTVFMIIQASVTAKALTDLTVKLRKRLLDETFEMNYRSLSSFTHGDLNHIIITEVNNVVFSFQMMAALTISLFYALVYTIIPLTINPSLVFFMFIIGLVIFPPFKMINRKVKECSLISSRKYSKLNSLLIQTLTNLKYLKSTNTNKTLENHFNEQSNDLGNAQFKQKLMTALGKFGFEPVVIALVASLVYYFVEIKGESIIESGFLLFLMLRSIRSILGMQQNLGKLLNCWGSVHAVKKHMNDVLSDREVKSGDKLAAKGDISIDQLNFSYGDEKILTDLSLDVKENTTVAFVGESGSGKSTLVNLIIGLLKPDQGTISVNGIDFREIDIDSYRKSIGYITQENVIFNDTLAHNITLWDPNQDTAKIDEAIRKAHLREFVKTSSEGKNTILGENGVALSGGQRQRVSIARELYKNPSLLICDEATSALDSATEKEIQKNIDEMKGECTIILIAHRLSTVKNADRIYVMDKGRIVEEGSFKELIEKDGTFAEMYRIQQ